MLHEVTWQQFLVAAAILSFIWYAALIGLCYRREMQRWFSRPARRTHHPAAGKVREMKKEAASEEVMGRPRLPEGLSVEETGGFGFADRPGDQSKRLGVVPDVMTELKQLFEVLKRERGTKADFFELFGLIKEKYPQVRQSDQLAALTSYMEDFVPFRLSEEELKHLWD